MIEEEQIEKGGQVEKEKFFTAPLLLIFVTVFIDLIGFGIVLPILPLYAKNDPFNATPIEIGAVFAVYSLMQFFFTPVLGKLSDRYGRRPILFFSLMGSALGYLVLGLANTLFLVFLGRIISGITGGNISTAQAYIADVTSKENRAKGMGLFGAAFGLGFILGPGIAGLLSKYGIHVPFYFAAILSFVNATTLYFVLPESVKKGLPVREGKRRFAELIESFRQREYGILNLLYFLLIVAFSMMTYSFVLYTDHVFNYNAEQNGYLFTFVGIISVIGQGVLFGSLVKRLGEGVLAATGCVFMVGSLFAIPLVSPASGGLTALLLICTFLALGNSFASPSLMSLVSKISHEHEQGKSLGIMQSIASLARAIGPIIGGFLLNNSLNAIDNFSISRTFWTASGIMFIAFLTAMYFLRVVKTEEMIAEI